MKRIIAVSALVAVVALAGAGVAQAGFWSFGKYASVADEGGTVSIPMNEIDDGQAHYYSFDAGSRTIKFFVLQSSDGVVRAAFDACDVCWRSGKGYEQDGEFMVCGNCGQRFAGARINVEKGGCNPAPLHRTVDGDTLRISRADILSGARYF